MVKLSKYLGGEKIKSAEKEDSFKALRDLRKTAEPLCKNGLGTAVRLSHTAVPDSLRKKVIVVIPTRNEEQSIGSVISDIRAVASENYLNVGILVVDDSDDGTRDVAQSYGALVVPGEGRSLGAAMYKGVKKAARMRADVILSIDGDGQFDPYEMPKLIQPILNNEADLVLGSRFIGSIEYDMPFVNRIGNKILNWIVRRITGTGITDAQTGFRAMNWEVAVNLEMLGTHTYVQETVIDAHEKGYRILEVPVRFRKRQHGKSRVVSSVWRYAMATLPVLILRAGLHQRIFPLIGIGFTSLGLIYGISVVLSEGFNISRLYARIPALILTTLMLIAGLMLMLFGTILHIMILVKYKIDRLEYDQT